uniref:Uncharacterized protein n=1 Tax=Arundo donax TaxID=35708 RepID=A0A0A8ZQY3_ARUDO
MLPQFNYWCLVLTWGTKYMSQQVRLSTGKAALKTKRMEKHETRLTPRLSSTSLGPYLQKNIL